MQIMSLANETAGEVVGSEEEAHFVALTEAYQARVGRFMYRMVGNLEDARDLTQDTFLRAYRRRGDLRSKSSETSWLFAIASNLAMDYHRRRRLLSFIPLSRWKEGRRLNDEGLEVALDERDLVAQVIAQLPQGMLECLLLYEVEGLNSVELGDVLGISSQAVRQRLVRARRRFRQIYLSLSEEGTS